MGITPHCNHSNFLSCGEKSSDLLTSSKKEKKLNIKLAKPFLSKKNNRPRTDSNIKKGKARHIIQKNSILKQILNKNQVIKLL